MKDLSISSLATRLGTIIVLPMIFLVPMGVFIDRTYGSLPFVTIGALAISAGISTIRVVRIVQEESSREETQ